jgi:Protein of unknown function, DUF417
MDRLAGVLIRLGILTEDLDYHLIRASMVIIFFFFGYQKWWAYEAQRLIPYISNGPLIFWLYPAFGMRGATWFLGVSEWTFGTVLFLGFWNKRLGILGALGSCATFIRYRHHHSVHAGWLGRVCGRVPGHDGQRPFPYEGYRSPGRIGLFAEAGCNESLKCCQTKA